MKPSNFALVCFFLLFSTATSFALTVPSAPRIIYAQPTNSSSIKLTWSDEGSYGAGIEGTIIDIKVAGTAKFTSASLRGTSYTYLRTGLAPNTLYHFRLRFFNAAGRSPYYIDAFVKTPVTGSPNSPSNLLISTHTGIRLTWTDNSLNESGFIIERSVADGSFVEIGRVGANLLTFADNVPFQYVFSAPQYRVSAFNAKSRSGYAMNGMRSLVTVLQPDGDPYGGTVTTDTEALYQFVAPADGTIEIYTDLEEYACKPVLRVVENNRILVDSIFTLSGVLPTKYDEDSMPYITGFSVRNGSVYYVSVYDAVRCGRYNVFVRAAYEQTTVR